MIKKRKGVKKADARSVPPSPSKLSHDSLPAVTEKFTPTRPCASPLVSSPDDNFLTPMLRGDTMKHQSKSAKREYSSKKKKMKKDSDGESDDKELVKE